MYNCGEVIIRCLDSIDYPNSEIIVVDDGSKDNGVIVVAEYCKTHPNVRLIQKVNGGVSSARNVGIKAANGNYIIFVDADDYLNKDGLGRIVEIAEKTNADIVKYCFLNKNGGEVCLSDFPIKSETIDGRGASLKRYDIPDYHIWDGLFRMSTISDNNLLYDEDLHFREDDVFMGKFYCCTNRVVITNLPLYRYIAASPYSSIHNQSPDRNRVFIQSGLLAIQHRSEYIKQHLPNEDFPYEKLKYMRWVCTAHQAVEADYSYAEYLQILASFRALNVWPVSYRWIKVAGWDYNWKVYLKKVIHTFMLNHPCLSYPIAKYRKKTIS